MLGKRADKGQRAMSGGPFDEGKWASRTPTGRSVSFARAAEVRFGRPHGRYSSHPLSRVTRIPAKTMNGVPNDCAEGAE